MNSDRDIVRNWVKSQFCGCPVCKSEEDRVLAALDRLTAKPTTDAWELATGILADHTTLGLTIDEAARRIDAAFAQVRQECADRATACIFSEEYGELMSAESQEEVLHAAILFTQEKE